jgi:two-component system sensor histidine kinase QseC
LILVSITIVGFYGHVLKRERLSFIDQQVRESASVLLGSELNERKQIDFNEADEIISEELGESRIGKFFLIRNEKNEIVFRSTSASLLDHGDFPQEPQWITAMTEDKFVRILNLRLPRVPNRTLQVGVILDRQLVDPGLVPASSAVFLGLVIAVGLIVGWFASSYLMRPIAELAQFFGEAAQDRFALVRSLPPSLLKSAKADSRDEFRRFVFALNEAIVKIDRGYRSTRLWSYQMAHELKTPLTLIQLQAEKSLAKNPGASEPMAISSEVMRMSETVQAFLSWAELENVSTRGSLFAERVDRVAQKIVERLSPKYPDRLELKIESPGTMLAGASHLEHVVMNLVSNALEYSKGSVEIVVLEDGFFVRDRGSGFPADVLARFGEPFNRIGEKSQRGHGLGLAWVASIARHYGWTLAVNSTPDGSTVTVRHGKNG